MSWRDEMTAAERKIVETAEAAKRAKDAKSKADADAIIRPIYERCTKRMMRAGLLRTIPEVEGGECEK